MSDGYFTQGRPCRVAPATTQLKIVSALAFSKDGIALLAQDDYRFFHRKLPEN